MKEEILADMVKYENDECHEATDESWVEQNNGKHEISERKNGWWVKKKKVMKIHEWGNNNDIIKVMKWWKS